MKKIFLALVLILGIAVPQHISAAWSDFVIVLDPGHGGTDPGACYNRSSVDNYTESWLALQCAGQVYNKLSSLGAKVYMTRFNDATTMSLTARKNYCYTYNSDVFISFHLNAANASAHGTETWYYYSSSSSLASIVQSGLIAKFGEVDGTGGYKLTNRGVKQNGWTVITAGSAYPAVLTEGLFVDCYSDWQLIQDTSSKGFYAWVDGHLKGIYDYLSSKGSVTEPSYYNSGGNSGGSNSSPYIEASSYSVNLTCNVGESVSETVTLDGNMLNQWTTVEVVCPEEGIFSVTPNGLNVSGTTHDFDPENPTITITFSPNKAGSWGGDVTGDGYIDSYVVLHSVDVNGDDVYQWIAINGTTTAVTTAQPYISVTPNNLDFNCNVGETATAEVTVDGNLLNMWTTVEVSEKAQGIFSVTPTGLQVDGSTHNFSEGHTKLTITFSPTEAGTWSGDVTGDGYNDYYVVLHSVDVNGNDVYQWVILNGTATGTSTPSTDPYISVTPNNLEFNCNVGESETIEVTVDGNLLNMWTTVEVSEKAQGIFSVTPTGLQVDGSTHNFSEGHTKLTITFSPTEAGTWSGDVTGDGYNDYYVVLHSVDVNGNDVYQWVILNGTATGTSTPSTDPYISVTPNYLEFNCSAGETQTLEVTVDGYLLNHWTYVDLISPEEGIFSVTPTGLQVDGSTHNFSEGWTTLYVTFSPKNAGTWGGDINNDGLADYYITLRSIDVNGNDVYQWIYLYGTATGTSSIEDIDNETISTRIVGDMLSVSGETPASIEVFSTAGAVVAQCNDSSSLNIASLPAGIYIVIVSDKSGYVHTAKISHCK